MHNLTIPPPWSGPPPPSGGFSGAAPRRNQSPTAIHAAYTSPGAAEPTVAEPAVAVRSSATAEDLPVLSFAGQYDNYLNVRGEPCLARVAEALHCFWMATSASAATPVGCCAAAGTWWVRAG